MDEYQQFILGQIGIDRYVLRQNPANENFIQTSTLAKIAEKSQSISPPIQDTLKKTSITPIKTQNNNSPTALINKSHQTKFTNLNWQDLTSTINNCQKCELCNGRKQAVIGVGNLNPDWLFVGEAPGAEEDQQGIPFVGSSGKLLDSSLASIGLNREQKIYIANAIKCRPPANRPPNIQEIAACQIYLHAQIALLKPKIIVAVGKSAATSLLNDYKTPLGKMRQQIFNFNINHDQPIFKDCDLTKAVPVVVTYHPSYIIRNLTDKLRTWEDLVFALKTLRNT